MKQKACFIICPIGEAGSEVRTDADLLRDFLIAPVLSAEPFSMAIRRADNLGEPGIITNQIIREIEHADLVVADLSFGNPNVFYEVAIRHVTRRPFVHLIRRGQRIPFDNAPVRAIEFDLTDLRSVDAAKLELATQAESALKKGTSDSPVSIAATMESLRESGNLDKIGLADLLAEVSSLRGAVDRLTANQIAAEKKREAITYDSVLKSQNALADALGTRKALGLSAYLAQEQGSVASPPGALGRTLADLVKQEFDKNK
jgi:hypothetical protein